MSEQIAKRDVRFQGKAKVSTLPPFAEVFIQKARFSSYAVSQRLEEALQQLFSGVTGH